MGRFATIISWVFHPLFVPAYAFVLLYFRNPYLNSFFPRQLLGFFGFLLLVNIVAPATSIVIMKRRGLISSLEMTDRGERIAPLLLVTFYYILSYVLLSWKSFPIPEIIYSMLLGMIASLIVALLITRVWKISMHTLAIGGVLGAVAGICSHYQYQDLITICGLVLVLGVVAFARLFHNHHSLSQIYVGAILGYVINYIAIIGELH